MILIARQAVVGITTLLISFWGCGSQTDQAGDCQDKIIEKASGMEPQALVGLTMMHLAQSAGDTYMVSNVSENKAPVPSFSLSTSEIQDVQILFYPLEEEPGGTYIKVSSCNGIPESVVEHITAAVDRAGSSPLPAELLMKLSGKNPDGTEMEEEAGTPAS